MFAKFYLVLLILTLLSVVSALHVPQPIPVPRAPAPAPVLSALDGQDLPVGDGHSIDARAVRHRVRADRRAQLSNAERLRRGLPLKAPRYGLDGERLFKNNK